LEYEIVKCDLLYKSFAFKRVNSHRYTAVNFDDAMNVYCELLLERDAHAERRAANARAATAAAAAAAAAANRGRGNNNGCGGGGGGGGGGNGEEEDNDEEEDEEDEGRPTKRQRKQAAQFSFPAEAPRALPAVRGGGGGGGSSSAAAKRKSSGGGGDGGGGRGAAGGASPASSLDLDTLMRENSRLKAQVAKHGQDLALIKVRRCNLNYVDP
jgi:hypothetical protein